MLSNRSVPPCTVIPVLYYPDPGAAADWLCNAFGFTVRLRIGNHRIQLNVGDGCLIVAEEKKAVAEGSATPNSAHADSAHLVMVRVVDANSHCEQASQHGARILAGPTDFPFGERQYNAEDFAGHRWTFTQTLADIAPEQWGGTPVNL
jgi:uncharacterized glyoxalase superfamily protein PhnB